MFADPIETDQHAPVPLAEATAYVPRRRGRKTHASTLYRWTSCGCRGVRLRYVQVGATRCTTRRWLDEFFAELTRRSGGDATPLALPAAHPDRPSATDRELDRLGVR